MYTFCSELIGSTHKSARKVPRKMQFPRAILMLGALITLLSGCYPWGHPNTGQKPIVFTPEQKSATRQQFDALAKLAAAGDTRAQARYGALQLGHIDTLELGGGCCMDVRNASAGLQLLEASAAKGNDYAQFALGHTLLFGRVPIAGWEGDAPVARDPARALALLAASFSRLPDAFDIDLPPIRNELYDTKHRSIVRLISTFESGFLRPGTNFNLPTPEQRTAAFQKDTTDKLSRINLLQAGNWYAVHLKREAALNPSGYRAFISSQINGVKTELNTKNDPPISEEMRVHLTAKLILLNAPDVNEYKQRLPAAAAQESEARARQHAAFAQTVQLR
jgi:hypothetical protein